jgi:hypothetical protein
MAKLTKFLGALTAVILPAFAFATTPPSILPNLQLSRVGTINAMIPLPDGSVIIGGNFTSISGKPRGHLARLNSNGELDLNWGVSLNGPVHMLATNSTSLFVLCRVTNDAIGYGIPGILKMSLSDGSLDAAWQPSFDGFVSSFAVSGTDVFVSGGFFNVNGQPRQALAKLSANGSGAVDLSWNPGITSGSAQLMVISGTNLFLAGYFYNVGGSNRVGLAKLSTQGAGAVDPIWAPQASSPPIVRAMQIESNYLYHLGSSLYRIPTEGNGARDMQWVANPSMLIGVSAFHIDGTNLYLGGGTGFHGEIHRTSIAAPSQIDPSGWQVFVEPMVAPNIIRAAGTNVFIGGPFYEANNAPAFGLVRFSSEMPYFYMPPSIAPRIELPGYVFALAPETNGALIVGGEFGASGDVLRQNLLRVRPDGSLDPDWSPQPNGRVTTLLIHSNYVFAAGEFLYFGVHTHHRIVKLDHATGTVQDDWEPYFYHFSNQSSRINALAAEGTNLFVAGDFIRVNDTPRIGLVKLSTEGAGLVETNWNPSPSPCCSYFLAETIALSGSNLFVGGDFEKIGGRNIKYLAKVSTTGTGAVATAFSPSPSYSIDVVAIEDTNLFVSGNFTNIGGLNRLYVAKLDPATGQAITGWNAGTNFGGHIALDGTNLYIATVRASGYNASMFVGRLSATSGALNEGWQPQPNIPPDNLRNNGGWPASAIYTIAARDGKVYLGGDFTEVSGAQRHGLAGFGTAPGASILRHFTYRTNRFVGEFVVEPGTNYTLQSTADFTTWNDVTNFTPTVPLLPIAVPATNTIRFFRLRTD